MDEKRLSEGKERIAAAAADLFLSGGYHNTSVREIAQKAGVSVGSVFNYFTSKEEILFFLLSHVQSETMSILQEQRREFERRKDEGAGALELFLLVYEGYVRRYDELRRYIILAHQELKSLTVTERRRLLEGDERIQLFLEEVIAWGVEQGAFPAVDVDLKVHCLIVLAQSWAIRHWALKGFTKVDDYVAALKPIALSIVGSTAAPLNGVDALLQKPEKATNLPQQLEKILGEDVPR
jgi:TetR/AcrR family transcriptional regulator, cholesterol catabolism regulator